MKLLPLICTIWLVASCPSWASDQEKRFLEVPSANGKTTIFDLNTVQIIQPGKFTILTTVIAKPDVMKLELKTLDTLRTYCARPDGQYPAPADLLTLGPPDMPVMNIEVKSGEIKSAGKLYQTKEASWSFPYSMLAVVFESGDKSHVFPYRTFFRCKNIFQPEANEYSEVRRLIMNGLQTKKLYDCRRGLDGNFVDEKDDFTKANMGPVSKGTFAFEFYLSVCQAVTHEAPYVPN